MGKAFSLFVAISLLFSSFTITSQPQFKEGDIVFQKTIEGSAQGKAISLATHSPYTHVGMILKQANEFYVIEAVQPVKITTLKNWILQGDKNHYVAKRLKNNALLTDDKIVKMKEISKNWIGKDYDLFFGWEDDKLYCSELVWKLYERTTGLEIGNLQKLKDFDLTHQIVKEQLKQRYGDKIPFDEKVISPAAMYNSDLLVEIYRN